MSTVPRNWMGGEGIEWVLLNPIIVFAGFEWRADEEWSGVELLLINCTRVDSQ